MSVFQASDSTVVVQDSIIQVGDSQVRVCGQGLELVLMLQGWPDTWRAWERQVPALAPHFRCARLTLPGFDVTRPRRGHSLDEITDHLRAVADALSPDRPVILMQHDWGSFFGFQFAERHPERVSRIVAIDVGDAHSGEFRRGLGARAAALIAGYQLWLTLAWRLHPLAPRLADRMTRWMARTMGCRAEPALIGAVMNYPYDITWTGSHGGYRGLPRLAPHCPLFYAWGRHKPVQFQSRGWLERMAAEPANRVMAFDSGHWVMQQRAADFNAAVLVGWLLGPVPAPER